jgi:hypothetical protein
MNCYYCNQKKRYFNFQNDRFLCQKCLNLNGSIIVKGDQYSMDIDTKYEFNIYFNKIMYFKFNIYKYYIDDEIKIGIDFVFDNKYQRLFENLNFFQFNLNYPTEYSKFFPDELLKYIERIVNFDEEDISAYNIIQQNGNINKLFQVMMNRENKKELYYFTMYNFIIYFYNYIKIVLNDAIKTILYDINYDKITPNFFAKKYNCDTKFKIVIPDLLENEKEWEEKIGQYLIRDKQLEEKREGKQQEMMYHPPNSYIGYPHYFHFILMDDEEKQIIGYCVCHLVSMNFIRNTQSGNYFLQTMIPLFIKKETNNINFQLFQNYLIKENEKTNLFYIDSLSVDKLYRGPDYAFATFLIYHALLFALNAKELNIGLVGVESAAKATEKIVEKFGFTNVKFNKISDEKIKKYDEIITKIENFILDPIITQEEKYIYDQNVIRFYDEDFQMNEKFLIENLDKYFEILVQSKSYADLGYLYSVCFNLKIELEGTKETSEGIDLLLDIFYPNNTITDVLYIDNPNFIQTMQQFAILMIKCVEEINIKSRKRKLQGEKESGKIKKRKLKFVLSMNQINKIFI